MRTSFLLGFLFLTVFSVSACAFSGSGEKNRPGLGAPSAEEAEAFMDSTEAELLRLWTYASRAAWIRSTYIVYDAELLASQAEAEVMAFVAKKAKEARRFDSVVLESELRRKFQLLKRTLSLPAPDNAERRAELAGLSSSMQSAYGKGTYCPKGKKDCLDLGAMSMELATSRDPEWMKELWVGWREVGASLKNSYRRYVKLANEGASSMGYSDLGELWRSSYDMPPDDFATEVDRLWNQVRPLYEQLHCYVRKRLQEEYGEKYVPPGEEIPAHLLGNMWAQEWGNLYPLLKDGKAEAARDLTEALVEKGVDEREMVRYGEAFFVSLGLEPLPDTFWERSLFVKPRDRAVVCHASAWDVDWKDDLRIKMCIRINQEDFTVIHHELGHNYYQRAYKHQSLLFADSANDGFHEALGDTVALSVTPDYLRQIGLVEDARGDDIQVLLQRALDKVAFLPFGLLVDKWRWKVFSGEVPPNRYNETWWALRQQYQGIAPPVPRTEAYFDPGAKYHIPGSVPYMRYFLAAILQFQFHRSLCEVAGYKGPLHECSIYNNKAAGARLNSMMRMGLSRPWPDALEVLTGQREMDASAIIDYFAPLYAWLKTQNQGQTCGW